MDFYQSTDEEESDKMIEAVKLEIEKGNFRIKNIERVNEETQDKNFKKILNPPMKLRRSARLAKKKINLKK